MKRRINIIFLLSILCGIVLYTGCGKEDNTVKSGTLSVIREEEKSTNDKLIEIDPFERLDIVFMGTAPNAKAEFNYAKPADYPMSYNFGIEPQTNLRNGDIVKMYIIDENAEQMANDNGYTLTVTEKEFTVEGVDYFVETLDQITEDLQNEMNERAGNLISENVRKYMVDVDLESYEFIGNYLCNKKNDTSNPQNRCFCVYKVNTSYPDGELSYYFCVDFAFIEIRNGRKNNIVNGGNTNNSFYVNDYKFIGYKTLDELYEDCITQSLLDNYTIESNVEA